MITFNEAKEIALRLEPSVDMCTETNDAFMFYKKDDTLRDGGHGDMGAGERFSPNGCKSDNASVNINF